MLNTIKTVILICLVLSLWACASSSIIMIGAKRAPTDPNKVVLYTTAPSQPYSVIGIVTARSKAGLSSDQQQLNYAVEAMKEEAAKAGANGVIITGTGDENGGAGGGVFVPNGSGGGYFAGSSSHNKEVSGTAIYVSPEKPSN